MLHSCLPGEVEVTFIRDYCRAGNLSALLKNDELPEHLQIYATRYESLYTHRKRCDSRGWSNSKLQSLDDNVMRMLVTRLNGEGDDACKWLIPEKWCLLSKEQALGFAPLQARGYFYKRVSHKNVSYSTFTANPDDSCVMFKTRSSTEYHFGRIFQLFIHRRAPDSSNNKFDTWAHIQKFPLIPKGVYNPLSKTDTTDVNIHLRAWGPTENDLIRLEEIICHCSWIMYKGTEVHKKLGIPVVALVAMQR